MNQKGAGERPYVEKLDAFLVCRSQTSRGDLEGLNDKACATLPGSCLTFGSARMQSSTEQELASRQQYEPRRGQEHHTTSNRSAQRQHHSKQALDKQPSPQDPLGMQLVRKDEPCRSHNALGPHPCLHPLRLDLRLLRLQGQVSWASTSLFNYSNPFDRGSYITVVRLNAGAIKVEWATTLRLIDAVQAATSQHAEGAH
jgi:hypothetical protein